MLSREKRETHLLVVDEAIVLSGVVSYPPHVLHPERHAEVVHAFVPSGIDHEAFRINAPRVRHWMSRDPRVDGIALHVRVGSRLSEGQPNRVAEALPGRTHADSRRQRAPLEPATMLQNEIGLAGIREHAIRRGAFDRSGPRFEEITSIAWGRASGAAKPLEPVLDALPMGYRSVGFCAIGILGEMADLIANLDRAFAEEAYGTDLGVVATEWAEL